MNKKLEELCDIVRGSSPRPQGDVRYYGGSIPRLMVSDLTRDGMFVMPTTDSLTEAGAKLSRPMSKGDLVIAVSGNPGLPAILKTDACIHDGFVGLRNLSKIVYTEYLYYYLFYNKNINHALAVGAIFKNLTTDQIKNLTIPLPDFDTQQKIAQILSEADKARQLRRSANALTDQFLQSTFLSMFGDPVSNPKGWPVKNLGNVLTNIRYGTGSPPIYSETGIPFIRATNIKKGRIEEKGMVYISNEEADKISKCQITQGDLIIVRSGVNTGDAAVISEQYSGCYAGYD